MAHGFQTLEEEMEVFYQMSVFYYPESAREVRWNDRAFSIDWPEDKRIIFVKDSQYSDYVWSRKCLSYEHKY